MPAFLARSTTSLSKRSVNFCRDIGRMTYVQKVFGDFGFGGKVTPFGNDAEIDCPKEYFGRIACLAICEK